MVTLLSGTARPITDTCCRSALKLRAIAQPCLICEKPAHHVIPARRRLRINLSGSRPMPVLCCVHAEALADTE